MKKSAKMSLGKFTYMISWAITGIFLIVLLVLFVVYKDTAAKKQPDTNGYNVLRKSPEEIVNKEYPNENQVFVKIVDVNNDGKTESGVKKDVKSLDGTTIIPLEEGKYLEISKIKMIEDYKNYFNFKYYYVNNADWPDDETNNKDVEREAIYEIDDKSLEQIYTKEAVSAQNDIAGVGLGFIILIFGSIMGTVFVSMKEKKGGKK